MKKTTNSKFRKKYIILMIFLCIYLITRLFLLFSVNLFNPMECMVGTITKELIIGPSLPIFDYPFFLGSHYPGRLLTGFLAVPFYLIFGESGISVKLMFLIVSTGIVCLVYLFLDRFFSRKAAIIAAMLMTFSLPVYTLSTMSQGSPHIESVFFDILIMFLFYKIFFDKKQDIKPFIFFGLACGFAIFVNISSLIIDKKFFLRKNFLIFIISFFIGLSSWIYYNITHNFVGLIYDKGDISFISKIFGNGLSFSRFIQIITKFKELIIYDLPKSFMFKNIAFFNANLFSYTYFFLFLCSFVFLFYYCRKSILKIILGIIPLKRFNFKPNGIKKETIILVYLITFCVIYSVSSFIIDHNRFGAFGYRYLITFYVFIFITISLFLTRLWNKKTKFISILLVIILILLGLMGNLSFVSFRDIGKGVAYRPYCYDQLSHQPKGRNYTNPNGAYQTLSSKGYAFFIKYRMTHIKMFEALEDCNNMNNKYKCFCYDGIGQFIFWGSGGKIDYTILQCNKIDKNYRHCCYKGIGWACGEELAHNYPNLHQSCGEIDNQYKQYFFEGFGQGMAQYLGVIPTQAIRQCNKIDREYRPYCFKGLAWSLAEKFGDNPARADKFRDYFYKGIGSYIGLMFSHNITRANEECNKLGDNSIYCMQGLNEYLNEIM